MLDLDFEPEMVGREENLEELQAHLEMATEGFGSTVLISGEAGIGKTRLVEEVKNDAKSKGFQVLSGHSLYESLTPYMPFTDALRSGGLQHLFAEEAPRVEGVYLVTRTGLLIQEVIREETELDPDLFASMLTTVGDFVRDSISQLKGEETHDTLNKLGYGNYTILIESGGDSYLAAILTGEENEFLIDDMRSALLKVNRKYGDFLQKWDGDPEKLEGIKEIVQPIIGSGKYDGIYYGESDPQSRRNLLFENVSLGLTRQAQTDPTLLCLEDLQWADPSSLSLMHYVARNTRKCRVMILGTYRPEDVSVKEGKYHPLVETMQLMGREELFNRLDLERLCEGCLPDFLSSLLGEVEFSEEFIDKVYLETEGNPLYIIELVKLLVDERVITEEDGIWRLTKDLGEIIIPSKIQDVIVRRLNRVESIDRKVLDYASVIGVVFTSETLRRALDLEKLKLLERLKVLEKTHNLVRSHNGGYRFDHAKVREVLYNEIPKELRMEYHGIVANSIEDANRDNLDEVIGDLAFHYYHCRNKEKAPKYLTQAAEEAKKSYSNEEAIRFYNEALEFEDERRKRREILESLGAVYELIGEYDRSLKAYMDALELVQDPKRKAGIWRRIGSVYETKGEYEESASAYAEAIDLVRDDESEMEANVVLGIGNVHWCKGEFDEALRCYQQSLEIAEKSDDKMTIAASMTNIGNIHINKGEYEAALERYQKSLELRESAGSEQESAQTLGNIGALHY
ncbi:MAG: tetratricopeptide repeat protein, partial [Thermoplasmata archaeon]|nr:tetratricopeptide repeat protein [Thermoplasmata archaeon]